MDLKLVNKRVLVTGSTGGIGAGIAQKFAAEGAIVVMCPLKTPDQSADFAAYVERFN